MKKTVKQLEQDYLDANAVADAAVYDAHTAYKLWQDALEKEE